MTIDGYGGQGLADAETVGHVDHVGQPDLVGQADIGAVGRLGRGVQQGQNPAAVAFVVSRRILDQVVVTGELDGAGGLAVDGVVYRVALLQGGEQGEQLETGPRLAGPLGDHIEVGGAEARTPHHGPDITGTGLDFHHGLLEPPVVGGGVVSDGLLGQALHPRVEVGVDLEPPLEQGLVALVVGGPERAARSEQLGHDLLDVIVGDVVAGHGGLDDRGGQGNPVCGVGLSLGYVAVVDHARKHVGPALARRRRGEDGVVAARVRDQAGQQGRLGQRELRRVLAEVGVGGRLHSVGPVTEIDDVQVGLQDLILGVLAFEAIGDHGLFDLAAHGSAPA